MLVTKVLGHPQSDADLDLVCIPLVVKAFSVIRTLLEVAQTPGEGLNLMQ